MPPHHASRALAAMDRASFSWFHIQAVLVAGAGFFTDAYDLFIINLIMPMISYVYYDNAIPPSVDGALKGAATLGTLIGQLSFGFLADKLGRKRIYGTELMLIILATLCSAMAGSTARGTGIMVSLGVWRFILGIGIGGDYPLSAVITSEFANVSRRGQMIATVFAMQGIGILMAALVTIITLASYKEAIQSELNYLDYVWRICLAFGALPALFVVYYRLTIPESPRYTANVAAKDAHDFSAVQRILGDTQVRMPSPVEDDEESDLTIPKAEGDLKATPAAPTTLADFRRHFSQWRHGKILAGCALSWLFLDIAFYGINLNQAVVLSAIGFGRDEDPYSDLWNRAMGNFLIAFLGTVPGYWVAVFTIEKLGRKRIQLMGFAMLALCLFVLSVPSVLESPALFVIIYTIAQFFFNFGPNTTTFVIPSEVFPTRFRSTAHGISAASGKFGAILAAFLFGPIKDIGGKNASLPILLFFFALFMMAGWVVTLWLPETMGKTLEQLSGEDGSHSHMDMARVDDDDAVDSERVQLRPMLP